MYAVKRIARARILSMPNFLCVCDSLWTLFDVRGQTHNRRPASTRLHLVGRKKTHTHPECSSCSITHTHPENDTTPTSKKNHPRTCCALLIFCRARRLTHFGGRLQRIIRRENNYVSPNWTLTHKASAWRGRIYIHCQTHRRIGPAHFFVSMHIFPSFRAPAFDASPAKQNA